jgi:1-acyl-sn-glycerol-3-phosphate acyltransferase
MKRFLGKLVLKVFGWKSYYPENFRTAKCVMIAAPHTSNWDLLFALAVFWERSVPVKYFIKDSFTKGIHGLFFKWLGAIGVDRSKKGNLVDYAADVINAHEQITMMVPAEGTRSRVEKWKTGFYHIATQANVPVALGYLDYKNKIAGVGDLITLTGNFEEDMKKIEVFYSTIPAKYPDLYNKKIF